MPQITDSLTSQSTDKNTVPLEVITSEALSDLSGQEADWVKSCGFEAKAGTICLVPGDAGAPSKIFIGVGKNLPEASDPWWLASACEKLPEGKYTLSNIEDQAVVRAGALGWVLAAYKFDRYLSEADQTARVLCLSDASLVEDVHSEALAVASVRDWVNTPTEDLGPADLQDAAEALAEEFHGTCATIVGDELIDANLPAIHVVGRAAAEGREPRLIDLRWGDDKHPSLTLVGKGVCFDTGGLDLKTGGYMRLMKKDMGGAANALGLARMIMANELKVSLRVLIPAVENAVAGNSYRPGDIIATRKGLSVEVGNTDAEGRIVLCDALTLASEENPDLIMDFATLTGAARVALGPDLPATYSNDDGVWSALEESAKQVGDPLWRMPLWAPYDEGLNCPIADLSNIADGPMGGSITAALYLQRFVADDIKWVHVDLFAWNPKARPARPKGGEAQAIRAAYAALPKILQLDE